MEEVLRARWNEWAVREVSTQCKLALAAFQLALNAESTDVAFASIQAFLSHCANVSKMLQAEQEPQPILEFESDWRFLFRWLRRLRIVRDRPKIGDLLGIKKSSMVHNEARAFRNNLEHYDQRLFQWLEKYGPAVNIGDFNVMPKAMLKVPNLVYIRHLDRDAHTFTFVDKDLDLNALTSALHEIKSMADKYVAEIETQKKRQRMDLRP